jgi:hypothetical protein
MEKTYSDVNISTNNPPITASKASKKRNYVTTRGNSCKFPQQVKKMSKLNATALYEVKPELTEMEISLELCKLRHCCPVGGDLGCIQNHFHDTSGVDTCFSESIKFFKQMRNHTRLKNDCEKDAFIQEIFRSSIKREQILADGSVKFIMEFQLDKIKVCRKAFAAAYGISIKELERCSTALKSSDTRRVSAFNNFRSFRDDTIHDYKYTETEEVFKLNLRSECIGNILIKLSLLLYLFIY